MNLYEFSSRAKRSICALPGIQRIANRLRSADGAEIAEAAVVMPLVFMLLLGIIWFGRAFNIYSTIQQAAQQGAITAAREPCATCANGNALPSVTAADNAIYAVMQASNLDVTQIQPTANPPTCGSGQACSGCTLPLSPTGSCSKVSGSAGGTVYICRNVQLNPPASNGQPPQCGSVVSFQYPFKLNFPGTSLNLQQIILSAQAQSRMEN